MKQQPSKLKYKKNHKISKSFFYLKEQKKFLPYYGNYCLKAIEAGKLNYKQIEACRKSVKRKIKRYGEVSIRVFTSYSITKKAVGIRMGKGKGNHSF
jgi:large subunit ribosomal protein L16